MSAKAPRSGAVEVALRAVVRIQINLLATGRFQMDVQYMSGKELIRQKQLVTLLARMSRVWTTVTLTSALATLLAFMGTDVRSASVFRHAVHRIRPS